MPRGRGSARVGVVTFPGSLDDHDARRAVERAGAEAVALWHADADLHGVDAVILPGGFSYGDYLRCGAIARFAPVMTQLIPAAAKGLPVLGICNGFQILCEAHLLPGALTRNVARRFINREVSIRIENTTSAWTRQFDPGQQLSVVLKSGEGAYVADERTLAALEDEAGSLGEAGIGEISIGCALGYLDFRFGDLDWRSPQPGLARFYDRFAARPSMQATRPS